ncbi:hypothetical protein HN512_04675 [Candidatus Peregrinibacteria bacterium]|jgi:hypothetical protein|nr:hypothetical protein [Candidatus Peregrinibacteria bacterium]MBT3599102.1 hypothetical protein [Candidatus Peregrinibacteria bacterium]MBT4367663.1 hypothetical protein [Candidatus Peregrinibacteria bacterium]MBT4585441.1 hypothetical protein [Candidatus Peregrinibacteria bacterium]MBT6730408.1 hypothetical protein [Candidatus Peregrinibacteria bacterium]
MRTLISSIGITIGLIVATPAMGYVGTFSDGQVPVQYRQSTVRMTYIQGQGVKSRYRSVRRVVSQDNACKVTMDWPLWIDPPKCSK